MSIIERTVSSLEGFLRQVKTLEKVWEESLWFRGQGDAEDGLVPGYYRHRALKGEEGELRYRFQQSGRQLTSREPKDKWEWYFLMQHHGAPTRLLDWSSGALLALHFALRSYRPKEPNPDAAVWALDPVWLHGRINRRAKLLPDPYDPENAAARRLLNRYLSQRLYAPARWPSLPIPIWPPDISPRFSAQGSRFTLHGSDPHGFESVVRRSRNPHLAKIRLRRATLGEILEDLDRCGVRESVLFPDLDGLGRELKADVAETPILPAAQRSSKNKVPAR
jgi:FRG domain-containing protein